MKKGILGRKVGMTQYYEEDGTCVPVTVIHAEPNLVVGLRTPDRDGYSAVQLGYGDAKEKHLTKPDLGRFKKNGVDPKRIVREVRVDAADLEALEIGAKIGVEIFEKGMVVDVTGSSKGKGFQGVIKRHHMSGMRATHGTHHTRRHGGSIGNATTPGRTIKNRRMPGQMGNARVTTQNLEVVDVDAEHGVLVLKGSVPGGKNGLLLIRPAVKGQKAKAA